MQDGSDVVVLSTNEMRSAHLLLEYNEGERTAATDFARAIWAHVVPDEPDAPEAGPLELAGALLVATAWTVGRWLPAGKGATVSCAPVTKRFAWMPAHGTFYVVHTGEWNRLMLIDVYPDADGVDPRFVWRIAMEGCCLHSLACNSDVAASEWSG